ncbi:MAG: acetamidase [Candidatus Angelobacter sp. Gp1-AA117]|nr:MAG: acetamidase [Candidatus Angelobacter sp. Gp1-AA117]
MRSSSRRCGFLVVVSAAVLVCMLPLRAQNFQVLQPLADKPVRAAEIKLKSADFYVPATVDTVRWGFLPNNESKPVLTVPSEAVVIFDTLSHEGVLEDQGRDPEKFFGKFGIRPEQVLDDAKAIAKSGMAHDFAKDGPHVVIGPVAVEGAQPGDVLKVEMVSLLPRVPYGVISNRHGKGALPGEFPENSGPQPGASASSPDLYNNVFKFVPIKGSAGNWYAAFSIGPKELRLPVRPFMGTMGVAPNVNTRANSIPPGDYGGNLDIRYLTAGSTLYLPVQVPGALFFLADPHFIQGNGEVALTAVEGSLRATLRLSLLKAGDAAIPTNAKSPAPFAETAEYWIAIGLDPDLNEAMKKATREAVRFVSSKTGMDRATAMAYLSAWVDFEVSQVVDRTKGIHALIRKADFK